MKHNYLLILCCFLFYSCSTDEIEKETPDPGEALEACFEISEETLMVGESLKLFNCSSGATTFLYDFGNGDASTLENPEITFTESGEYTITLTVGNDKGETKTFSLEITVISVEGFYIYPDIAEGYSAIPLEMGVNPDNGKLYYIELLVDEVGSGGSKFYYRELAENYETEGQYLADKPYNSNSAFVNFYPSGKKNFVFSRTLNSLYGTQEVTYDAGWAFLNGVQSAKKHSYGVLAVSGSYLYYGADKSGDYHEAAIEIRNSNGDAFQVITTAIPDHQNASIGDMIAIEGGFVAFGGVFTASGTPPYITDYKPLLMYFDEAYALTDYVIFEDSALTGMVNTSDQLNGSFHLESLSNGNLVMYAMGEMRITNSSGNTLKKKYFEETPNNQALVCLGNSFVISTRDYLKKYDLDGNLLQEYHYGGQILPEIMEIGESLFFVAGYEAEEEVKLFFGKTDLDLNPISLQQE
ncbi:MAG: hypothetical protein HKP60_01220 [Eudoraea sp.]|nr:PKD domain-containing protein [Eudoraea sp.]NNJ39471.1 hypothetical protein [Eudoraea sp.]